MTIKEMRKLLGLSQAAFSQKYGIPKRSIENWEMGVSKCPDYVMELLERCILEDGGRTMKIYEYQRNDEIGTHYYAGNFRRDEACMWELEVALPDGVGSYESVTGEPIIEYDGMKYMLSECLLANSEVPTLRLYDNTGDDVHYTLKVLSRREFTSIRTID